MRFLCPKCQEIIAGVKLKSGAQTRCPNCKAEVRVPAGNRDKGVVIGDFELEKEIAKGGMGIVYLARQISLDRPAALKILIDKYARDAEFVAQFVREARAAAKMNHPNVVQAYAVGEDAGVFYFAMEYIDGKTVKELLKEKGKLPPDEAAKYIRDIAGALDFAWGEKKLIHHDIKPDNIILTGSGRAKLADLGLAKLADMSGADVDSDNVLGTPQYISPEQLMGEPCDGRSDLYSLGATFYHMLTGQYPYTGSNANETAQMHVTGTLKPPGEIDPAVPRVLSDIVVRMMQKKPADRYASGAEVVAALNAYLSKPDAAQADALAQLRKQPGLAAKKTAAKSPKKPRRKLSGRTWVLIASGATVFLLVGGGTAAYLANPDYFHAAFAKCRDYFAVKTAAPAPTPAPAPVASPASKPSPVKPVPPPAKKLTYIEYVGELTGFFRKNPAKEQEFLEKVDQFLAVHPKPANLTEQKASAAILDAYNRIDERLRVNPVRQRRSLEHQKAIDGRRRATEERHRKLAEEKRRKEQEEKRQLEEAKRKKEQAEREAEIEKRKQAEAERKAERRKTAQKYLVALDLEAAALPRIYLQSVGSDQRNEFTRFVDSVRTKHPLPKDAIDEEKAALDEFDALAAGLLSEYDSMRSFAEFLQDPKQAGSVQFEPKRGDFWQFSGVDPVRRKFKFYSAIEDKNIELDYNDKLIAEKLLPALKRRRKEPEAEFYLMLFGRDFAAARGFLPEKGFWRDRYSAFLSAFLRDARRLDPKTTEKLYSGLPEYPK